MEDRQVKFDVPDIQNELKGGEIILDVLDMIEDTKGNSGDSGRLLATNMRVIWYSISNSKFNLSVGWATIITMTTKTVVLKVRGTTEAMHIMCVYSNSKYEFIFTNKGTSQQNFLAFFEVLRKYQSSGIYREMKLRSAIITEGHLNILRFEEVFSTVSGIWNLSSDQGNLGTFIVTNIRLVWYADINDTFNMSLPYIQIESIQLRQSKYGVALVISCKETGGGYVLGFRIDPPERLEEIYKELRSLFAVYSANPIYGIELQRKNKKSNENETPFSINDVEELDDNQLKELNHNFKSYLADGGHDPEEKKLPPVYCKELGFAIEKLRDGYKIKDLFEVIPS